MKPSAFTSHRINRGNPCLCLDLASAHRKRGIGWTLAFACAAASLPRCFIWRSSRPPFRRGGAWPEWLWPSDAPCGVLHTAIFNAISPMYRHDPVATVNLGGMLFGLGCLTVALLVSGTFYIYSAPTIQVWIAIIPALFGWLYVRSRNFSLAPAAAHAPSPHAILAELRSPGAVIFSLLLFFQFGNEWTVAGWLPLFLSQRLGISPETSLGMLALYWLALLVGRVVAQWMLPARPSHTKLLISSVLGAMFGCVIVLIATNNRFGAIAGVLLLGSSFAPIYPLVVERINRPPLPVLPSRLLQRIIFSFAFLPEECSRRAYLAISLRNWESGS